MMISKLESPLPRVHHFQVPAVGIPGFQPGMNKETVPKMATKNRSKNQEINGLNNAN